MYHIATLSCLTRSLKHSNGYVPHYLELPHIGRAQQQAMYQLCYLELPSHGSLAATGYVNQQATLSQLLLVASSYVPAGYFELPLTRSLKHSNRYAQPTLSCPHGSLKHSNRLVHQQATLSCPPHRSLRNSNRLCTSRLP
jgi:hypothetical protein